jgi:hypothetical protein
MADMCKAKSRLPSQVVRLLRDGAFQAECTLRRVAHCWGGVKTTFHFTGRDFMARAPR